MSTPAQLGSYPIERELGRGGMGVVYLGRDPKLDRLVAIKVVPPALAQNPDNLARFEREAKMLASVNHPNIAAIYAVEEAPSTTSTGSGQAGSGQAAQRLLVMEYVAGDTLADRLARGALPIDATLDICRQIAAAIEAAHEAGIVHRDLKPGNVKITPDETVKVLDFGLAKGGAASSADLAQSPTLTYSPTAIGVILGTAGYMSPEQARGKPVDRRADVWAFGCVLFECLTGRKIFEGETVSDTIARILEREPAWDALPAATPTRVRELLRRCLEKDIKKRQRDMGDVRIELDEALAVRSSALRASSSEFAAMPAARTPLVRRVATAVLFTAIGAALGIGVWSATSGSGSPPVASANFSINIPAKIRPVRTRLLRHSRALLVQGHPRRPDGSEDPVAHVYRRPFDSFELTPIAGSEGAERFWLSPDERWMVVRKQVSLGSADRRLFKLALDDSSAPMAIGDWDRDWNDAVWLHDNSLLVHAAEGSKILRVPTGGGSPSASIPLQLEGNASGYPTFEEDLPGGAGVLMDLASFGPRGYREDVWVLDAKTGKGRRLVENGSRSEYQPATGYLLFSRQSSLLAVRLDLSTLAVQGEVISLFDGLRSAAWGNGGFFVSREGHLVFPPGGRIGGDRRLVTVGPNRDIKPFSAEARAYETNLDASADGRHVAVVMPTASGTYETWTATIDRPGIRRVLSIPNADASAPVWSPNGEWLAFLRVGRDASDGVYVQRSDGSGQARLLMKAPGTDQIVVPTSWATDNTGVFAMRFANGRGDIFFLPVGAAGDTTLPTPRSIRATAASEVDPRLSPDGQLLAFISDEHGRFELHVTAFANGAIVGDPLLVSNTNVDSPHWSSDSHRLYYLDEGSDVVMSTTIDRTPRLRASAPVPAFDLRALNIDPDTWSILPDNRLIGVQRGEGEGEVTSYQLILNWLDTVRARLPLAKR